MKQILLSCVALFQPFNGKSLEVVLPFDQIIESKWYHEQSRAMKFSNAIKYRLLELYCID
jgi:hypothetical protein